MKTSLHITINGKKVQVEKGSLLLDVIRQQGIHIPTLCSMKEQNPYFSCRLCVVYEEQSKRYIPSCRTQINQDMSVVTHNAELIKHRQLLMELLLASHPDDCLYCVKNEHCYLRKLSEKLHIQRKDFVKKELQSSVDKSSNTLVIDYAKCIACGKCVVVCNQIQQCNVFQLTNKGVESKVVPEFGKLLQQTSCVYCGECMKVCPTAALFEKENIESFIYQSSQQYNIAILSPLYDFDAAFAVKNQRNKENKALAVLKSVGFHKTFSQNAGIDLFLYETYHQLMNSLLNGQILVSSFCPSALWFMKKYVDESFLLSTVETPSMLIAKLLNYIYPKQNVQIHDFSSCIAQKQSSVVDNYPLKYSVYTLRELLKLQGFYAAELKQQAKITFDEPLHIFSGLSYLPFIPGGTALALARMMMIKELNKDLTAKEIADWLQDKDFYIQRLNVQKKTVIFGIINGLGNIEKALKEWKNSMPDFIDVLACPGGCCTSAAMSLLNAEWWKTVKKQYLEQAEQTVVRNPFNNKYLLSLYDEYKQRMLQQNNEEYE